MTSLNAVNHVSFPSISAHDRAVIPDFVHANLWDVPQLGQVITLQFKILRFSVEYDTREV